MCGICGFIGGDIGPEAEAAGRRMRDVLAHRGPDGADEALARDADGIARGWLGHRRLKILDLTEAAAQPMMSEDSTLALTYNGEIYNYRELREKLRARGHRFASTGDTEVLLRAYEEWGEGLLDQLDGMFAFAIWDGRRRQLLMARDRTGKKPLFYAASPGRITFGSEIKALRLAPWLDLGPDLERLPEFLAFGYVPQPDTLYENVRQVPPGGLVVAGEDGTVSVRRWWDALPARLDRRDDPATLGEIRDLMSRATERRLLSDVPLGAFLSGGIDSSVVVGLMSKLASEPVRTFCIGFPEDTSFDERAHARRVADHFGAVHTEWEVRADAVALLDRLLWFHDQPYADSSAIPTYLVCQMAQQHVTVALSGDGGDEVFGGYDRFVAVKLAQLFPSWAVSPVRRGTALLPRSSGYFSVRRRAERFLERVGQPAKDRYQSWIAVFSDELLHDLLPNGMPATTAASMQAQYERAAALPELDQILYANLGTYLPDDLHVKVDRMSMANSLEVRSPFLDTAVIELAARIPAARKVGWARPKPVLRRAFGPLLPEWVWRRRKHGFGVPMGAWFRGDLRELFEDSVLAPDARSAALLDPVTVRRLWSEHQNGSAEHGPRLWPLLCLERWLRDTERPPAPIAPDATAHA
jgi:asparagine synthase (glutamine-hydrolysing)